MDSWEGTVAHPKVTGARRAGPPMSPPERDCTAFQRPAVTRPSGDSGIEGGPNDYERKTLCGTKSILRVKFRDQFAPTGPGLPVTDKRLTRSNSHARQAWRHLIQDRSYDVLRGSRSQRGGRERHSFRKTGVGELWGRRRA